ncbi:MAG: family RecB-like putative nuclease [Candidatus Eremiobacteraeota bacterium]|nr:family RecB-like putative nuclease [Candidatus Eremiobacteraeota bacterium]
MRLVDGRVVYAASDLNDYLACPHRVALNRRALLRGDAPPEDDATLEIVARKGREHELRVLARMESEGVAVVRVPEGDATARDLLHAVETTLGAMRSGAEAIYQASFLDGAWTGRADFLIRVDEPSALGPWSYDVADTKLAIREKPQFLVQLCTYALLVASVQGALPRTVRALFGNGVETAYDPRRYAAYVRAAQRRFADALGALDPEAVPERVPACEACAWAAQCNDVRRGVDHLSLVAGMRRDQTKRLVAAGIGTLERLATATVAAPPRMAEKTFATLRRQAALQLHRRVTGSHRYELLEPRAPHGFAALPQPAEGDVYFDMEGDPLYEAGNGLEYLFGAHVPGDAEQPYREFWGETREQERLAFEAFVDWLTAHRTRYPHAHVYHYASYEKTALRRLAMRHGTREDAVDDLLRGEVLVDLYAVVKGALAQSQDGYSLKKLEVFYGFVRDAGVRKGDQSIVAFEEYLLDRDARTKSDIIRYNEEDCVSTRRLHEWLLKLRDEARAGGEHEIPFRAQRDPRARTEDELKSEAERDALQRALLDGVPDHSPRALLAHLLAYHRREDKPVWWALFDRYERDSDFVDEDSEALGGLALAADVGPYKLGARDKNLVYTYRFPAQQHKLGKSKPHDPHARRPLLGELVEVDDDALLARIKRAPDAPHPRALIPGDPIQRNEQKNALRRFAESVLDGTAPARYSAAWDVLVRARPRVTGLHDGARVQPEMRPGAEAIDPNDVAALARRLDGSALVVQGPPGTGKTYTGAHVIAALLADGKRIGVTSTSHKAINNLLCAVEDAVAQRGETFRGVKKCDGSNAETRFVSARESAFVENADKNAPFAEYDLVAGTAWLFARDDLARVDYLVIDEAGQVALADALATATNAGNVILLGDPLQLAHVSLGTHPEGAGASVLEHLLGEHDTVPDDRGVFLDRTFRMHPALCDFVSTMVYEGRLCSAASCATQRIDAPWFTGAGLRYAAVDHDANTQSSEEEAAAVEAVLAGLVGGTFTDRHGATRPLGIADVLVVSPYNAQVRLLKSRLRKRFGDGVRVGTVDKFQGQEAPAVIYSLATSSADDAPRGADFLFEANRFNVALSRGRALAVVVCSPRLLETRCTSVEQLGAVAAFCAFAEAAAPL